MLEERQIDDLARRHLESGDAERIEQIGGRLVERRGQKHDAAFPAMRYQPRIGLRLEFKPFEHGMLALFGLGCDLLIGRLGSRRACQPIGRKSLELDRIGAGRGRDIDQLQRQFEVAIVIDARLGDDETRLAAADAPAADDHRRAHAGVLMRSRISARPGKS